LNLPRYAAVTIVVLPAFGVIFGLATLMFAQVSQLAGELPRYQSTLSEKIETLRGTATASGTLEQASQVLRNLQKELDRPKSPTPVSPAGPDKPIPVEVHQPDPGALQTLAILIAPLIHPLATTQRSQSRPAKHLGAASVAPPRTFSVMALRSRDFSTLDRARRWSFRLSGISLYRV
jgi:hypothetical protein